MRHIKRTRPSRKPRSYDRSIYRIYELKDSGTMRELCEKYFLADRYIKRCADNAKECYGKYMIRRHADKRTGESYD